MESQCVQRAFLICEKPALLQGLLVMMTATEGVEVVGHVRHGSEAIPAIMDAPVDIILLHGNPGEPSCEYLIRAIRRSMPQAYLLVVASEPDEISIVNAIRSGADNVVSENVDADELTRYLQNVNSAPNLSAMTTNVMMRVLRQELPWESLGDPLTKREMQVLHLLAEGLSNKEIANRLELSMGTIKNYVHNVLNKLGARSRGEAMAIAWRSGMVSASSR